MKTWLPGLATALLVMVSACGAPAPANLETNREETAQPIIWGTPAPHDFLETGLVMHAYGACTGTLIAPQVVLTAAHCLGPRWMYDESVDAMSFILAPSYQATRREDMHEVVATFAHPRSSGGPWLKYLLMGHFYDVALLYLREPIVDVAPAQIMREKDARFINLHNFQPVTFVGYGLRSLLEHYQTDPTWGTRYVGHNVIAKLTADYIKVGFSPPQVNSGDSGGPLFVNIGSVGEPIWRIAGVASYTQTGIPRGAVFQRVDPLARWIDAGVEQADVIIERAIGHR